MAAFQGNSLNFPNLTSKSTPIGADILLLADSAAANAVKQCLVSSLPFAPASGTSVVNVTGASQTMAINTTYFVNYTGGVCTLTLPAAAPQGSLIWVIGGESVSNPWVIAQLALQSIRLIDQVTTVGVTGTLTAANKFNTLVLHCDDAAATGLTWTALTMGTFTGA
jgi:hypothetical protein